MVTALYPLSLEEVVRLEAGLSKYRDSQSFIFFSPKNFRSGGSRESKKKKKKFMLLFLFWCELNLSYILPEKSCLGF